jgi:hypothetical protein
LEPPEREPRVCIEAGVAVIADACGYDDNLRFEIHLCRAAMAKTASPVTIALPAAVIVEKAA